MSNPGLLEVIALDARDAENAQKGGADRLELVSDMAVDGLSPEPRVVREVLAATDLPVRVMLRDNGSFARGSLDSLRRKAAELVEAGATEFVFGYLTGNGAVDTGTCAALAAEIPGPWTFHRAVDHARDVLAAHRELAALGCDTVLSAGHPDGVAAGLPVLRELAGRAGGPRLLVGGGLRAGQVPPLRAAGADAFHIGSAARPRGWAEPVDVESVREWADLVHQ
ncbi:copper homeostasis protein CutC [Amycolatopsis anabasis]|uniref:copper homeostasis protein CutC n=1 Tax=Amycolatopsis anabasis TaxID=1840409 RepID=UPI0015D32369|nr:copper homeostasis protein CutC [Amycolatopsis anabasis]